MVKVYVCKFSDAEMFDDDGKVFEYDFGNEVIKIVSKKVENDDGDEVLDVPTHFRYAKDENMKKK